MKTEHFPVSYFVSEETAPEERDSGKKKEKLKTPGRKAFVQRHPVSCIPTLLPPPRKQHF